MLKRFFKDNQTRKKCHIYQMLKNGKSHLSFHTPGHKVGKWDLTELSFSDNLSSPRGCIAKAERDVAQILHAHASFILTDGSTSGVFSMLFAAKTLGVKTIALPARVHKSATNACQVLNITALPYSALEEIESVLQSADALFVVSPDYYGTIPPLNTLRALCDQQNKLLLIDGAHGGHLHFSPDHYAGEFADIWVDGVHKSLPALTQGAVVSAKTEKTAEALQEAVQMFRTTSPSYPIMASVEYAVKYPRNESLEQQVRKYANTQPRVLVQDDWTKLCARFGEQSFDVCQILEKQGIFAEFCDGDFVVFYLSPATSLHAFKRLQSALDKLFRLYPLSQTQRLPAPVVLQKNNEEEWVELSSCEGRVCAKECGLFPPCTSLFCRGEQITKEKLQLLQKAQNVYGVFENKICVFKEENV